MAKKIVEDIRQKFNELLYSEMAQNAIVQDYLSEGQQEADYRLEDGVINAQEYVKILREMMKAVEHHDAECTAKGLHGYAQMVYDALNADFYDAVYPEEMAVAKGMMAWMDAFKKVDNQDVHHTIQYWGDKFYEELHRLMKENGVVLLNEKDTNTYLDSLVSQIYHEKYDKE